MKFPKFHFRNFISTEKKVIISAPTGAESPPQERTEYHNGLPLWYISAQLSEKRQKEQQKAVLLPPLLFFVSLPVFLPLVLTIFRRLAATSILQKPPCPPRSRSTNVSLGAGAVPTLRLR
jgi:hypothetical protein